MDADLLTRAQTPGEDSELLLLALRGGAREAVLSALADALAHREALELADYLAGEPLSEAVEAAQAPRATLELAHKALAKEQHSIAARLAAYWKGRAGMSADDDARPPAQDTQEVQELKAALTRAEAEAFPFTNAVAIIEERIAGLRAAPTPDAGVLAVLAAALNGGSHAD